MIIGEARKIGENAIKRRKALRRENIARENLTQKERAEERGGGRTG